MQPFLAAFWELSNDRSLGFSVGPIPSASIDRYANRHGYSDPDDFDELTVMIRAMDDEYLAHIKPADPNNPEPLPPMSVAEIAAQFQKK